MLSQQYAIDMAVKVQDSDISWYNKTQNNFRSANCSTYAAATESKTTQSIGREVPKGTFLPKGFRWGDRRNRERFRDVMAMSSKMGNPSLFITMTANVKWKEIQEELNRTGEDSSMRPDIVDRVFKMKLRQLEEELYEKGLMGKCVANTRIIEFQKVSSILVPVLRYIRERFLN
jgi:hypothetical protein